MVQVKRKTKRKITRVERWMDDPRVKKIVGTLFFSLMGYLGFDIKQQTTQVNNKVDTVMVQQDTAAAKVDTTSLKLDSTNLKQIEWRKRRDSVDRIIIQKLDSVLTNKKR